MNAGNAGAGICMFSCFIKKSNDTDWKISVGPELAGAAANFSIRSKFGDRGADCAGFLFAKGRNVSDLCFRDPFRSRMRH